MPRYRDVDVKAFPVLGWFSDNCKAVREAYGEGQIRFAQMCGLSQAYYNSIENLKANPKIEVVGQVAAGTGVSVARLLSPRPGPIERSGLRPWTYRKGEVQEIFAENCLALRTNLDMSQEQFAALCKITQAYYSTIENFKATPTLEIVSTIAHWTKTTPAALLGARMEPL